MNIFTRSQLDGTITIKMDSSNMFVPGDDLKIVTLKLEYDFS